MKIHSLNQNYRGRLDNLPNLRIKKKHKRKVMRLTLEKSTICNQKYKCLDKLPKDLK